MGGSRRSRPAQRSDQGFTLVELMIVVLIIAILVAIAVPTFLGQREAAQDRAAQVALRNALVAQRTVLTSTLEFTDDPAALSAIEPGMTFVNSLTPAPEDIGVMINGNQITCMTIQSQSGTWFGIWDAVQDATSFGEASTSAALFGGSCPNLTPPSLVWAPTTWK